MAIAFLGLLLLRYAPPTLARGLLPSLFVVVLVLSAVWLSLRFMGPLFERVAATNLGSHARARSIWRFVSYLVLGAAETVVGLTSSFKPIADRRALYGPNPGHLRAAAASSPRIVAVGASGR